MEELGYTNAKWRSYITGVDRSSNWMYKATHLYDGDFQDPGKPLCKDGYNRNGWGYSIFRNNISKKGICKVCKERADKWLDWVE